MKSKNFIRLLIGCFFLTLILAPSTRVTENNIDLTTQQSMSLNAAQSSRMFIAASGGNVLWDLTHGLYASGYTPSGDYSNFTTILSGAGYTVTTTTDIANTNLASYKVLVICLGSAWNSAYTVAEQSKIQTFVQNGGGLLIMGDNKYTPNANINIIAQTFGITLGGPEYLGNSIASFTSHAIFTGITKLYFLWFGELTVSSPANLITWDTNSKGCLAVAQSGSGRVVAIGDIDFCRNLYFANENNQKFSVNIFDWLSGGGSGWTGGKFDFNDGTTQGWTKEGAFDEAGNGPFFSNFTFDWYDYVNHPNAPGKDPSGDAKGSLSLYTWGGHGVPNPTATWWIMRYKSPDLSGAGTWQTAKGYTVEIAECMSPLASLYANLYVTVYDKDQAKDRYFYSGATVALTHDVVSDNIAVWNHLTFDWSAISTFPTNFSIKNIFVNLWGRMDTYIYQGGTYLDEVVPIMLSTIPDISPPLLTPIQNELSCNYPNPFNPATTIKYTLSKTGFTGVYVYNTIGQRLRTLSEATQPIGIYEVAWDGRNELGELAPSGIYFYQIVTTDFVETKKMMLLK